MKIAVIGGGGREHAIIKKLAENKEIKKIYAVPGNGGISKIAQCVDIRSTDISAVVDFCAKSKIDYVVVAPDDPLANGMVDALGEKGIPAFGPGKEAAQIESSKVFSKNLMKKHNIPTADFETFGDIEKAEAYIIEQGKYPVVVKADGLALGKGVVICKNEKEAKAALKSIMEDKVFGASGNCVVVEEFMSGPEVSVLAFCDGKTLVPMISSMDHKRALNNDMGLNTGGMGTIAPNPLYKPEMEQRCMEEIFLPTVRAMEENGTPFKGCLYFGLMVTSDGPKVIEYNCRFGDPEAQVVLPLLKSDLLTIMQACTNGNLKEEMVEFSDDAAACIILASGGYPGEFLKGFEISGLKEAEKLKNVQLYHGGTKLEDNKYITAGGRVLGVGATAESLPKAIEQAYKAVDKIHFDGMQYRTDIGRLVIGGK